MQLDNKLLVFPTSRSIRNYISSLKEDNTLLPTTLSIDNLFKNLIYFENKNYCDEEQRLIFLHEAIQKVDIEKLGISKDFTVFLKQKDYIYSFFQELASEKVVIDDISRYDTYAFYDEHLAILKELNKRYIEILELNNFVDKINLIDNYFINKEYLKKFSSIEIFFEGYFTKLEFDIINEASKYVNILIHFHSNKYNQKSLSKFKQIVNIDFKNEFTYTIDISNSTLIEEKKSQKQTKNIVIESFSHRFNQIAFIKQSLVNLIEKSYEAQNIAVVLPDETFAQSIQLFDREKYFNYAMGKSITMTKLYQVIVAITHYISEDDSKNIKNLEFLTLDKSYIDMNIKSFWTRVCTKDKFEQIVEYIKSFEENIDLLVKFDELIYKLNILLFSKDYKIALKDVYKILLQRVAKLSLDDVNSGKITVLGVLETRAYSFDAVIIPDFNEDYIPRKSLKDKFLSSSLKKSANLPTNIDRENLQKYYYKRLVDNSKEVYISYTNNEINQISRFALELFDYKNNKIASDKLYSHILYENVELNPFDEEIKKRVDLQKLPWSATSLKSFLECKRRYYLKYIYKIKEHNISQRPKAYEIGNIVHKILEEFYKTSKKTKKDMEELFIKYRSENPFLIVDLAIWKEKLLNFIELDRQKLASIQINRLEEKFSINYEGFVLNGVIDRIDKIDNNSYELIDYKTSSSLRVDTKRTYENSVDFQLEFYYLYLSQREKGANISAFYYDLYNNKILREELLEEKINQLKSIFSSFVDVSKEEINFEKTQNKTTCQYCPYTTICNRD